MRPSSPRSSGGWRRPGFCRSPRWACRRRPRRPWRSRSWPIRPCAVFRATFRPPPAPLAPWCSATSRQGVDAMRFFAVGRVAALVAVLASCAPLPPASNVPVPPAPPSQAGPGPKAAAPFGLDREPSIDVGLAWDADSLSVAPTRPAEISRYDGGGSVPLGQTSLLHARVNGGGWRLEWRQADGKSVVMAEVSRDTLWVGDEGSGRPAPGGEAREPRRSGPETAGEPLVRWNGKTWRGRFKIFLGPRGKLTLAVRGPPETHPIGGAPGGCGPLGDEPL